MDIPTKQDHVQLLLDQSEQLTGMTGIVLGFCLATEPHIDVQSLLDLFTRLQFETDAGLMKAEDYQSLCQRVLDGNLQSVLEERGVNAAEEEKMMDVDAGNGAEDDEATQALIRQMMEEEEKAQLEEREEAEEKNKPDCEICFDKVEYTDINPLDCGHIYHPGCIGEMIKSQVTSKQFPIKCPNAGCSHDLTDLEVRSYVEKELYDKFVAFNFKDYIEKDGELIQCPTADCEYVFSWEAARENQRFMCQSCQKVYCMSCKVDWHEDETCEEFQKNRKMPREDRLFLKHVQGSNYKQCAKCKFYVSKTDGCDHMTCRCGYEFCYICGEKYKQCPHTGGRRRPRHDVRPLPHPPLHQPRNPNPPVRRRIPLGNSIRQQAAPNHPY